VTLLDGHHWTASKSGCGASQPTSSALGQKLKRLLPRQSSASIAFFMLASWPGSSRPEWHTDFY